MKKYPKLYEDFLTSDRLAKRCKLDKITIDTGIDWREYATLYSSVMSKYQEDMFIVWLRFYWLFKRFCYFGHTHYNVTKPNNVPVDRAFSIFFKKYINYDAKIISRDQAYRRISSYFYDLFPDLDTITDINELNELKYPYRKMNFNCLCLVYLMPERLELLKYGEDNKMDFATFVDYIINYINCYNEDHAEDKYAFLWNRTGIPYIKVKK